MNVVTMAEVELYRVGSAAGGSAFESHRSIVRRLVVQDASCHTLRDLVVAIAVASGERGDLSGLKQVSGLGLSAEPGVIVFDVDLPNIQYGQPYAACRTFPALESDGRYFRLEELQP